MRQGLWPLALLECQPACGAIQRVLARRRIAVQLNTQGRRQQFSEVDYTDDLKKISVSTLILHGDDDQIVPIDDSAKLSVKIVRYATLKVYKGAPHGMCSTHVDQVNADLPEFLKS